MKTKSRPMPASALIAWRYRMGLSQAQAASMTGLSKQALVNAEARGAPLYVAYACAALEEGIKPCGIKKDDLAQFRRERKIDGQYISLE